MEEEDFQEIDGTLVGPGGFAVTDDGVVISASKLTVPQLRAELTARGLPTEGKRADLYRRVQVALSASSEFSAAHFSGHAHVRYVHIYRPGSSCVAWINPLVAPVNADPHRYSRPSSSHVSENSASRRIIREQDSPLISLLAVAGAKHAMALSILSCV